MELARSGGVTQITALETFPLKLHIIVSKLLWAWQMHSPLQNVTSSATLLYFLVGNNCLELAKALLSRRAEAPAHVPAASDMSQTSNIMFDINARCNSWLENVLARAANDG